MKKLLLPLILLILPTIIMTSCTEARDTNHLNEIDTSIKQKQHMTENTLVLPEPILKNGTNGENVKKLQTALNELGYNIEVTGKFDKKLTAALKDFQSQQPKLLVSGEYNQPTKDWLAKAISGEFTIKPGKGSVPISNPKETVKVDKPSDILVLVNKSHALPVNYVPEDLIAPNVRFPFEKDLPKRYMRKEAALALEELFKASDKAGLDLFAQSGYRSYERQDAIFASYVARDGEEAANNYSARPGESEHQTGLTMDVTSPAVKYSLTTDFANTEEGNWLKAHAHEYGFIIRYPKGKEHITKYQYEPWHLRYVGSKVATVIHAKGITLEEYLGAV
ncbi:D-alanyl-D-alanine carboxypeptidase family protein [Virgibacillus sp. DJP39]|uniref:D-alanyl-D-alanine carboxypeptidase family protein n=1 Tax=Virgibacillus sp. DJP39 TaxID=3409790 RepID=UPI003BB53A0E